MKKTICIILAAVLIFSFAACGGGGSSVRADSDLFGKYIAVSGEMWGITLSGDELGGFSFDLQSGGKGTMEIDGDKSNINWENDDTSITVTVEKEKLVGTRGQDTIKFENMLDMGMDLTFAKEGTDAANPDNYLPENDKFMLGSWQSAEVTDIFGDPVDMDPEAMVLEFTSDHRVNVVFNGDEVGTFDWSLLGDWGSLDNADDVNLSWDILEDSIEVSYTPDDEYYLFTCYKGTPGSSAKPEKSDTAEVKNTEPEEKPEQVPAVIPGGTAEIEDYASYWAGDWYGWWIIDSAFDEYEDYEGLWWDACATIEVEDDDTGMFYMWDEDGSRDELISTVSVSFGPGTTAAGCMMSEAGDFMSTERNVLHADWIVDPGASDISDFDHMICITGTYEDDYGSFVYEIYLRPWGMDWDDLDEDALPAYYDWYKTVMDKPMPDSIG